MEKTLDVGKNKYEIHMLYGIRDAAQRTLVGEGHTVAYRVRVFDCPVFSCAIEKSIRPIIDP